MIDSTATDRTAIKFLLVDDDDVDRTAVTRAFRKLRIANEVVMARDGIEALEILRGENGHVALTRPYMILLDLNMPRMNGLEFLETLRKDDALSDSIVFILTTSKADEDRCAAYKHHVAGYIVKTQAEEQFIDALKVIDHYWRVVEFPT